MSPEPSNVNDTVPAGELLVDLSADKLLADRAYDSDPLDEALAGQGVELVAPHRKNRKKAPTQDGRVLRRYKRRWKIERLFAWLNKFRKVITRWERCAERYTGLVYLAFCMILLRRIIKSAL